MEWKFLNFLFLPWRQFVIIGLEVIDPLLDASQKKLIFVSVWWSFCVALFLLNRSESFFLLVFVILINFKHKGLSLKKTFLSLTLMSGKRIVNKLHILYYLFHESVFINILLAAFASKDFHWSYYCMEKNIKCKSWV